MDEKLKAVIDKIVRLSNQNHEFDMELRKRLQITPSANALSLDEECIKKIEKYLGLDFNIDSQKSTIDYSFIEKADVRNQLISDNREMMRFRYGTRYHKVDFDEFCRYALLQSEMLLNYYYDVLCNSDLEKIIRHIKTYNKKASGLDSYKSLSSIPFNVKLWAFKEEYEMKNQLYTLENIRIVRNELSHRSTKKDDSDIETYQNLLNDYGIPLDQKGFVNSWLLGKNPDAKNKFDEEIKKTTQYKQYKFKLWYKSMPFETIIDEIDDFSKLIKKALKGRCDM